MNAWPLLNAIFLRQAKLLRVRWMRDSDRYDTNVVANELSSLAKSLKGQVLRFLYVDLRAGFDVFSEWKVHTSTRAIFKTIVTRLWDLWIRRIGENSTFSS